jgi:hypothetical protein
MYKAGVRVPLNPVHAGQETIPDLRNRLDKARRIRGIVQSLTDLIHDAIEALVMISPRFVRPKGFAETLPRDDFAGVVKQQSERLKWLVRKSDSNSVFAEFPPFQIHFEHREARPVDRWLNHLEPPSFEIL